MTTAVYGILGKTIKAVIVKVRDGTPRTQLFLIFSDDTYYEFYGDGNWVCATGGVDSGGVEAVRRYMPNPEKQIEFLDRRTGPSGDRERFARVVN